MVVGEENTDDAGQRTTSTIVPLPGLDSTSNEPPTACARSRMLIRPNPSPRLATALD